MSPFTKVLIVLLSLAGMFTCGATIAFVASSTNWKAEAMDLRTKIKVAEADSASSAQSLAEMASAKKAMTKKHAEESLLSEKEKAGLKAALATAERKNNEYAARLNSLTSVMAGFQETVAKLEQSLSSRQAQLDETRAASIKDKKHLNETISMLVEKSVLLETEEAKSRRLLERTADLERKVTGSVSAVPFETGGNAVVTVMPSQAGFSRQVVTSVTLNGLITEVGQSLVTISIGAADGVTKGMTFHVTRGSDFVCDVIITDVDTNKAAGVLELVKDNPRVGDNVSNEDL